MDFENSKALTKLNKKNKSSNTKSFLKKKFVLLFNEILLTIILFLGILIAIKVNTTFKDLVYKHVYTESLPFTKSNELYKKYLGDVFPNLFKNKITPVFNSALSYKESSSYYDGTSLKVGTNYLVPLIESGIVVFIGEKEHYGSTVIIQQVDGVNVWYGNITDNNIKMYDYVEKGALLGEVKEDMLYLVLEKDDKYLKFKDYQK